MKLVRSSSNQAEDPLGRVVPPFCRRRGSVGYELPVCSTAWMRVLYRRKDRREVVQRIFDLVWRSRALKLRQRQGFFVASFCGSTCQQSLDGVSRWHEQVPDFCRQRSINQDKLRA